MDLNFYRFCSEWYVHHCPGAVYRTLDAFEDYPIWWRGVRSVQRLDDERFEVLVQASLPYGLRFEATAARRDPAQRILGSTLTGDLESFSRIPQAD